MGIYDREYYRGETGGSGWFSGVSPVCKSLIGINVAVFLLDQLINRGNNDPFIWAYLAASPDGTFHHLRLWELLTATFLHAGPMHLLGNMVFLWIVGREMEALYGSRDFLAFYVSAAIFSTLAWCLVDAASNPDPTVPMMGASGAVMATMMLFTLFYPKREILFFFIPMPIWVLVTLYLVSPMLPVLAGQPSDVAIVSHLGGAGFAFLFKQFDLRWSRLFSGRVFKPRLRIFSPVPREQTRTRSPSPSRTSATVGSAGKSAPASVIPEEQLDAKLDEVLAKIAREGRSGLTEEELRVLQEASRRARIRRRRPHLSDSSSTPVIRDATPADAPVIIEFNRCLALETEEKVLDPAVLSAGVARALADPTRLRYWVAELGTPGHVVGQAAISLEWSDWRDGWVWWLQSVFVEPPYRGCGVFRALYRHIERAARGNPDVIGLRLYVDDSNQAAKRTYQALGMKPGGYSVFEELWIERFANRAPSV